MQLFWLVAAIVLFVIEAGVPGLVCIWFGAAAVVSMVVSFFVESAAVQMIVFIIASAVLLFSTRGLVKKVLKVKEEKTNADRFIGQDAIVIEPIDNLKNSGRVSIYGFEWKARAIGAETIAEGSVVTIREIRGVTARVELKK